MQWHGMDWPVLWDPFNLLEFSAVPVTYLLDEEGTVLVVQPLLDRADDLRDRTDDLYSDDGPEPGGFTPGPPPEISPPPTAEALPSDWSDYSVSLVLWGGAGRVDEAVDAARKALEGRDDPVSWFRLGVVLRMRYDSDLRQVGDFAEAVAAWSRALDADPNQYIWRRRLQQYGPRLAKPYPFYDWVSRARTDIEARGERPHDLAVEPHGAELAQPATDLEEERRGEPESEPDPDNLVQTDQKGLVDVEAVLVPPTPRPGETIRVHLVLSPNQRLDAHWNNEAGHGELWVIGPRGRRIDPNHQVLPVGPGDVSDEERHLEFEVEVPETGEDTLDLTGYLLYYVCESATGVCVYLRQDVHVTIPIAAGEQAPGLAG